MDVVELLVECERLWQRRPHPLGEVEYQEFRPKLIKALDQLKSETPSPIRDKWIRDIESLYLPKAYRP